jgi:NAD(P)-dependent dehydrogenase (short-subunit alcohol dehydrogenase family)
MRMADKVALVTGAGSGIGRGTALRLAEEGATVIAADINGDAAKATADETGGVAIEVNVGRKGSVTACFEQVTGRFDHLDLLVNCAGICVVGNILETDEQQWDAQLEVNLKSVYLMSKSAWPLLTARRAETSWTGSVIVNIASTAGFYVFPGESAYTAAKAGVIMLTKSMAMEGARDGVRVHSISPGPVQTGMSAVMTQAGDAADTIATFVRMVPLGRIGQPRDVANGVLFLASEDATWATGMSLVIDGGCTLGLWGQLPGYMSD